MTFWDTRRKSGGRFWQLWLPAAVGILLLGAASAYGGYQVASAQYQKPLANVQLILDSSTTYKYVHPLLYVKFPKELGTTHYKDLNTQVAATAAAQGKGAVTRYAFYYKDLNSGYWTGINETAKYDPGSLLKVVVAIAAYREGQEHAGFLSQKFVYTPALAEINSMFPFAPPVALTVGQSYSFPTLIKDMLSESDNASKDLLLSVIDPAVVSNVFTDLSVPKPNEADSAGYTISALDYSRFFRILYYGTYDLTWKYSDELLADLSTTTFSEGLTKGVPASVPVAHKFGEHVLGTGATPTGVELSDCGIVYHPAHPYFICVMTEGKDPTVLAQFIATISQQVYTEVDADK